jgi:Sec-independent protein translocase protein TatA
MFGRLMDVGLIALLLFALFGRNRLPASLRSVRKSARIMKSEMQSAADDVDLPEPKVISGHVIDGGTGTDSR